MRKIWFLLTILLTALIPTAYGFELGYTGIGGIMDGGDGNYVLANNANLTVPTGYKAVIDHFYVYTSNLSAAQTVHGAIYDSNLHLLAETDDIDVNGLRWYSVEFSLDLLEGTYWIAAGYTVNATRHRYDSNGIVDCGYEATYDFNDPMTKTPYDDNRVSMYFTFEYHPVGGDPAIWAGVYTFGLIALFGVILVMFKMKIPILQMAVGVLGVMVPLGLWAEPSVLFTPFLQISIVVTSFILVAYSAWSYRQGI